MRAHYAQWSDEDLLRVVNAPQDYRAAAVQAAREILTQRDPTELAALTSTVVADLEQEEAAKQQVAEEPLGTLAKTMCFVFCGIPGILFAAWQESKGRSRRSREAWTWLGYGWLARIGLASVIFLLSAL